MAKKKKKKKVNKAEREMQLSRGLDMAGAQNMSDEDKLKAFMGIFHRRNHD